MRKTQCEQILNYMLKGRVITPIEALNKFGCMRLGARILELKKQGIRILSTTICKNKKHFSGYFIDKTNKRGKK